MKLIGIVGRLGPESTIDYYRLFISIYRERKPDGGYPPLVINSVDLARALRLVGSSDLAGLAAYMIEEIRRLARAGATHPCCCEMQAALICRCSTPRGCTWSGR